MDPEDSRTLPFVRGTQVGVTATVSRLALHRQSFVVMDGPDRGLRRELVSPIVTIGTAPTNDVALTDSTVSRHHCEIVVRDDRAIVRDLGSTNGTLLDGVAVIEAFVEPGSRLRLGETEIVLECERSWVPIPASQADRFGDLRGGSAPMRAVFGMLEKVARTPLSVVFVGETGTGKELAARALHAASLRSSGPLVVVDCGALHENLVESELFGHDKGAFTGADRAREGAFERAQGGTILLDEIGELPLELQPKLLRVLERREVRRLGSSKVLDVDVRIVAATHRDLPAMVASGTFREDLFYRLAEVIVRLPPLRERLEDLPMLVAAILDAMEGGTRVRDIAREALEMLATHSWPGNVRELRNTVRRAAALAEEPTLRADAFEPIAPRRSRPPGTAAGATVDVAEHLPIREARDQWIASLERAYLERLVARYGTDIEALAQHIGVHRKSVYRLLRQHQLID